MRLNMWVSGACLFGFLCVLTPTKVQSNCRAKSFEIQGDVILTVIMTVRGSDGHDTCNTVSYEALQNVLAINYAVEKLNSPDSNGQTFIPGVKIGYKLLDDCGDSTISQSYALDILRNQFPASVINCSNDGDKYHAGVVGASRSLTTKSVATVLRNSEIPIISVGATSAEFSNKTLYPNLWRTVHSDTKQVKAIISLLDSLGWTRFALIHTDDNYGASAAHSIEKLVNPKGICISFVRALPSNSLATAKEILLALKEQQSSYGGNIGVVFIGQREGAEVMIRTARSLKDAGELFIDSIMWIFSESVGTSTIVLSDEQNFSNGVLTLSMVSYAIPEFESYFQSEMEKRQSSTNPWIHEFQSKSCVTDNNNDRCNRFEMNDFVSFTLDAVYALAFAVKQTHKGHCGVGTGICEEMKDVTNNAMDVVVDYGAMDPNHAPLSFIQSKRKVQFDAHGDVLPSMEWPLYQLNMFWNSSFETVGYFRTKMEVNMTRLRQKNLPDGSRELRTSTCQSQCEECQRKQPFIYIPGDVIVVAFVSIHQTSKQDPYKCGETRSTTNAIPSLEALLHLFNDQLKTFDGQSFGLLVFDDCYSFLKAEQIMSDLFSSRTIFVDERSGDIINASSILAVLGPEPSGIAVPIAQGLKKIMLPQVSYSASTPDLDDRHLYPYFLRPVPSDNIQAKAMIEIVKDMKWNYIDIIYTNNNYGLKGMQKISEFAALEGVCVGKSFAIEEKPDDRSLGEVIKNLSLKKAKVVLFFGTGESAKGLLNALKNMEPLTFVASEDWGVNPRTIEGIEEQALGSLIVTLDTSRVVENSLRKHLQDKFPSDDDINPWFAEFWQEKFKCNFPWSFRKIAGRADCRLDTRLGKQDINLLVGDQRIVHTINSVYAIVSGLIAARKFLCQNTDNSKFICDKIRQHPAIVTSKIRETVLFDGSDMFSPFKQNGNGNIGFQIHNLKRTGQGNYHYETVGEYSSYGLNLRHEDIRLYDYTKERREIKSISSECITNCTKCKKANSVRKSGPSAETKGASSEVLAVLVITCLLCILVVLVIIILVSRTMKKREKYVLKASKMECPHKSNKDPQLIIQNPSTLYTFSGGSEAFATSGSLSVASYDRHQVSNGVNKPAFGLENSEDSHHSREFATGSKASHGPRSVSDTMDSVNQAEVESIVCPHHQTETQTPNQIQRNVKCPNCDGFYFI